LRISGARCERYDSAFNWFSGFVIDSGCFWLCKDGCWCSIYGDVSFLIIAAVDFVDVVVVVVFGGVVGVSAGLGSLSAGDCVC